MPSIGINHINRSGYMKRKNLPKACAFIKEKFPIIEGNAHIYLQDLVWGSHLIPVDPYKMRYTYIHQEYSRYQTLRWKGAKMVTPKEYRGEDPESYKLSCNAWIKNEKDYGVLIYLGAYYNMDEVMSLIYDTAQEEAENEQDR